MKAANLEDLEFHVIWKSEDCDKHLLVDIEKAIQIKLDVVRDDKFFNLEIANSRIYHPDCKNKAVEAFKKKANSISPDGRKWSEVWSQKAHAKLDEPDENGLSWRQKQSEKAKEMMSTILEDGRTVARHIADKANESRKQIGEDGLTLDQRKGRQFSKWLNDIDPDTGLTYGQIRAQKLRKPVNIFGIDFDSKIEAYTYFSLSHTQIEKIYKEGGTTRLYNKLCKMLGKDHVDSLGLTFRETKKVKQITICDETFPSIKKARIAIGCPKTAFEAFVRDGTISKKIEECFINYFGLEKYNMYYHGA